MNINYFTSTVLTLGMTMATTANAGGELLLSSDHSGSLRQTFLTIQSDGQSRGLAFRVHLPKGTTKVNAENCAAAAPNGVTARCLFNEKTGILAVAVLNMAGGNLPAGEIPLGSVDFASLEKSEPQVELIAAAAMPKMVGRESDSTNSTIVK